jgi:hypothetical protein
MTATQPSCPWYVSKRAVSDYRHTLSTDDESGGNLKMLKTLKIVRSIIVNLGIISISLYSISTGADATLIGTLALGVLGGYNGLEFSDYLALVRAYRELESEGGGDGS